MAWRTIAANADPTGSVRFNRSYGEVASQTDEYKSFSERLDILKGEIDQGFPPVLYFWDGYLSSIIHAVVAIGYYYNSSNQLIVRVNDPAYGEVREYNTAVHRNFHQIFTYRGPLPTKTKFSDAGMLNGAFGQAGRGDKSFVGYFNHSKSTNSKNDILQIVTGGTYTTANPAFYTLKADGYYGREFTTTANLSEATNYYTGDVDGDGYSDLIYSSLNSAVGSNRWKWLRNNQNGLFQTPATLNDSYGMPGDKFYTLDFNGDGKVDILNGTHRLSGSGNMAWFAMVSNGSSFVDIGRIYSGFFGHLFNKFLIGDVNGDGKDDILAGVSSSMLSGTMTWYVMTSNGSYASVPSFPMIVREGMLSDDFFLTDVSGDRKADLITAEARTHSDSVYNWYVAQSTGSTFSPSSVWMSRYSVKGDVLLPGKFRNTNSTDFLNGNTRTGGAIQWFLMYGNR